MRCPNCGEYNVYGIPKCGCTIEEKLAAMKIRERERRERLRKEGRPVLVDHLKRGT